MVDQWPPKGRYFSIAESNVHFRARFSTGSRLPGLSANDREIMRMGLNDPTGVARVPRYKARLDEIESMAIHGIMNGSRLPITSRTIRARVMRISRTQSEARRSSGGEVQVSAYTRSTGPVQAYTRSRPS